MNQQVKARAAQNNQLSSQRGASMVEILIIAALITTVSTFGVMGITKARASLRLSGAAREFASYIEKSRTNSIRRHADSAARWASVAINSDRLSYVVTMDVDGDGTLDSKAVQLPEGISFDTQETIAFDWRGRTQNTVGGVTTANAQVAITLRDSDDSISVDVTGSGDVTIDSQVFDDSVPNVNLKVDDLSAGATPTPSPSVSPSPIPDSSPISDPSPSPVVNPDLNPIVDLTPKSLDQPILEATPTPTPSESPQSTPAPTPTPTPEPTPDPEPTPVPCSLIATPDSLTLSQDGTATVAVIHNSSSSITISGTSSRASDLQVSPANGLTVAAGSAATFTIKSKKISGSYAATFYSSTCGSTVVSITVQ